MNTEFVPIGLKVEKVEPSRSMVLLLGSLTILVIELAVANVGHACKAKRMRRDPPGLTPLL
jgi:hypothetical protein